MGEMSNLFMLNTKDKIKNILQVIINDEIDNPKFAERIVKEYIKRGLPFNKVSEILTEGIDKTWDTLTQMEQIGFVIGSQSFAKNKIDIKDYFGENVLKNYYTLSPTKKQIEKEVLLKKFRKVDDFNYYGYVTYEDIYKWYVNGLLFYNTNSQRDTKLKRLGTKGLFFKTFNINRENVEKIAELMLKKKYNADTIILNSRIIKNKEMNLEEMPSEIEGICDIKIVPEYDDKKDNQTILDIVDGMHRIEGVVVATEKNLAEKGSYLKGGLFLNLVVRTVEEARGIVAQTFERSDLKDNDYKELLKNDEYTVFLNRLIDKVSILEDNVTDKFEECVMLKKLTYKGLLLRTIKFMNLDLKSRAKIASKEETMSENINDIVDYLKVKFYNDSLELMKESSIFLSINIFCGYVFISDKIENYNTLTKFCDKLYECQDELAGFKLGTKNFPMGVLTNFFYNILKDVGESD